MTELARRQTGTWAAPRILVAEDDPVSRQLIVHALSVAGHDAEAVGRGDDAWARLRRRPFDLLITDVQMPGLDGLELLDRAHQIDPDLPVLVVSAGGDVERAVRAIRLGAYDYLEKPVSLDRLLSVVKHLVDRRTMALQARAATSAEHTFHDMIGRSPPMRLLFETIRRIARYPAPVLILGESGVGKELVARAIHLESLRSDRAFVAFNAAGVTESLFESALFGHRKGAFTGAARDHVGLMEASDGGTLFMDEVGEMSPANQAKLLRALETQEIRRVGDTTSQQLDLRVVAATNADLIQAIRDHRFREDLYYRLRGVVLEVPTLRQRPEDIPLLAAGFLARCNTAFDRDLKGIEPDALDTLSRHSWPGNVRELRQVISSAAMLAPGPWIRVEDLPAELRAAAPPRLQVISDGRGESSAVPVRPDDAPWALADADLTLQTAQRRHALAVLARFEGHKGHTAEALGVSRHTLYRMLKGWSEDP